LVLASL